MVSERCDLQRTALALAPRMNLGKDICAWTGHQFPSLSVFFFGWNLESYKLMVDFAFPLPYFPIEINVAVLVAPIIFKHGRVVVSVPKVGKLLWSLKTGPEAKTWENLQTLPQQRWPIRWGPGHCFASTAVTGQWLLHHGFGEFFAQVCTPTGRYGVRFLRNWFW